MATHIPYLTKYSAAVKPLFYDGLVVVLRICTPRMQICFVNPIPSFDLLRSLCFRPSGRFTIHSLILGRLITRMAGT